MKPSKCFFCGGPFHASTGATYVLSYAPRSHEFERAEVRACGPCVRDLWAWARDRMKGPRVKKSKGVNCG